MLVGVLPQRGVVDADPLAELAELARSAGALVVARAVQRRRSFDPATCVGRGKLEEIRRRCDETRADVVIFDNELSPSQIREIERATGRKVLDRSELILDIFASRARTAEAQLQVELAQLEYTAPRLRGMWSHLERIAGAAGGTGAGVVGGIGTRGPGERQIEIDRRIVERRIAFLRRKLAEIEARRQREVRARSRMFTVALVGYTNAGKSTLTRTLTNTPVAVEDRLFMTLDTRTCRWHLGEGLYVLLSDSVGFVRDLPHHLIASFHATLTEALNADLLLHVVDAANPHAPRQIEAVEQTLKQIGAADKPTLLLLNKIDAVRDESLLTVLRQRHPQALEISARRGTGLERLRVRVAEIVRGQRQPVRLSLPAGAGRALSFLRRYAEIRAQHYDDGRVWLDVRISPRVLAELHKLTDELTVEPDGQEARNEGT